jgi:hypothetical protein
VLTELLLILEGQADRKEPYKSNSLRIRSGTTAKLWPSPTSTEIITNIFYKPEYNLCPAYIS